MTETERSDKSGRASGEANSSSPAAGQSENPEKSNKNTGAGEQSGDNGRTNNKARKRKRGDRGRGGRVIGLLALLIALIALFAVLFLGYRGHQRLQTMEQRVAATQQTVENIRAAAGDRVAELEAQLQSRLGRLANRLEQRDNAVSQLRQQLEQLRTQVAELSQLIQGGNRRWQLLQLERLLLTANRELQLEHNARGALQALKIVSQRLGQMNDPRLTDVRKKVINAIAELKALPNPDIQGLALKLAELSERVSEFPLASDIPDDYSGGGSGDTDGGSGQASVPAWRHFLDSVTDALQGMFTIRRSGGDRIPLMPPEQAYFLRQNLQLKLQAARLALLQHNPRIYRASLSAAREWLQTYFDTSDPAVAAAIETLGHMQKVRIAWEAPDISGSLVALRAYLEQTGNDSKPQSAGRSKRADSGAADGG